MDCSIYVSRQSEAKLELLSSNSLCYWTSQNLEMLLMLGRVHGLFCAPELQTLPVSIIPNCGANEYF